ncbi:MAG: SBBP repeat-containing protein, partial [Bacteroidia bacterium]|nr:SBBP repeat-containing protein [Bacteroidia bacterium]
MFKKILCLFLFMGIGFFLEAGNPSSPLKVKTKPKTTASAEKTLEQFNQGAFSLHPFGFMENKGQITGPDGLAFPEAKFEFQQGNTRIFLLNKGIAYQFTKTHYPNGYLELIKKKDGSKNKEELEKLQKQIRTETYRMNMCLQGANANAVIIKENQSSDVTNYYNLNALNVHYYAKITYKEIYPGIDWIIYTKNKEIKYDFVVRPGADPSLIKMQFDDQEDLKLNEDGSFTIKNALGEITEKTPISHQYEKEVATSFLLNKNILSFNLEKYDTGKDLIIDPALSWATYYSDPGFFAFTYGLSCCTDGAGNVYLSGQTLASSNIASSGHQNSNGGASDAFLVKFNSAGVRQWATFYGGTGDEDGYSCCIDASNNVYLAGSTTSGANIASGGHQNFLWAGIDAYLVKFNSSGVRQWATYYGGADTDYGYACCTDPSGNVYLAGTNGWSSSFLASGGHQNSQGGGGYTDAFLVKFNSSGARQWATYYGGNDTDEGRSCCSDPSGNVYLAGWSQATNNIASGGHQNSIGGFRDAYLVKFNGSGVRQWGTYYGGVNEDLGNACCTDPSGNV